jgi:hypothetical protein
MRRSVEGVIRTPKPARLTEETTARPQTTPSDTEFIRRQLSPHTYAKSKAKKRRQLPLWLQMLLISLGAMTVGSLIGSSAFGQVAVLVYGLLAFTCRIASRTTFLVAMLSLAATTWLLVMQGNVAMAQNFATYTFLFLVVGVLTLSRELRKEGGRIYSSRKPRSDS